MSLRCALRSANSASPLGDIEGDKIFSYNMVKMISKESQILCPTVNSP